jgi:PqqD family protein of HPr-rel-A system
MAGPRFQTDPEALVRCVELDGLSVLFHEPSGMTHIVAPPAPQILEALRLGPADAGELIARLSAWYDFEGDEAADAIDARLEELEAAGLVSRAA